MKRIYLLSIVAFIMNVTAMAQEQVFRVDANNNIVVKSEYIEDFGNTPVENSTPYTLKFSETVKMTPRLTSQTQYIIKGLRYKGWTDADPGDFNVIEVLSGRNSLLTLKYDDGWDDMSTKYGTYTSKFCGIEKLDDNTFAAIFKGVNIMSQPPYLTIIVIKDGKASMVFNKHLTINEIKTDANGNKVFHLQENVIEWIDENTPSEAPVTHTMTIKNGMIYFE